MKARELLTEPDKWTQNVLARDSHGHGVPPNDEEAQAWCLAGAVWRCYPVGEDYKAVFGAIQKELDVNMYLDISDWNDDPECTFEKLRELVEKLDI